MALSFGAFDAETSSTAAMRNQAILVLMGHGFRLTLVLVGGIRWEIPLLWLLGTVATFLPSLSLPKPKQFVAVWRTYLFAAGLELALNVFVVFASWLQAARLVYESVWAGATALTLVAFAGYLGSVLSANGRSRLAIGALVPGVAFITSALAFILLSTEIWEMVCLAALGVGYVSLGFLVVRLP